MPWIKKIPLGCKHDMIPAKDAIKIATVGSIWKCGLCSRYFELYYYSDPRENEGYYNWKILVNYKETRHGEGGPGSDSYFSMSG